MSSKPMTLTEFVEEMWESLNLICERHPAVHDWLLKRIQEEVEICEEKLKKKKEETINKG